MSLPTPMFVFSMSLTSTWTCTSCVHSTPLGLQCPFNCSPLFSLGTNEIIGIKFTCLGTICLFFCYTIQSRLSIFPYQVAFVLQPNFTIMPKLEKNVTSWHPILGCFLAHIELEIMVCKTTFSWNLFLIKVWVKNIWTPLYIELNGCLLFWSHLNVWSIFKISIWSWIKKKTLHQIWVKYMFFET
jgi:hypothetical protein